MENSPPLPTSTPDAPDKEKMDQIRRRRLEKLQGSSTSKAVSTTEGVSSSFSNSPSDHNSNQEVLTPNINITSSPVPSTSRSDNPFAKLGGQPGNKVPASSIRITPANGSPMKRTHEEGVSDILATPPARKAATQVKEESIEAFEHRILGNIFRITLEENSHADPSGHHLTFLPELKQELEADREPIRLSVGRLEPAIMEAASKIPHNKAVLDYLMPCWKRVVRALKNLKGYVTGKDMILKEAKRLCMSNCIFAITMPELFGREPNPSTDSFVPYLLRDPEDERGVCMEFLSEAVSRFEEDDTVKPMLVKVVADLSYQLSNLTMNDDYKPFVYALKLFTRFKPVTSAIAEDPMFQMATSAPGIEKHTLLGPFFRISPLQPEVTRVYFGSPKTMDKGHVKQSQDALRLTLNGHQKDLLDIINEFLRASTTSRNRTLDWFAYVVNENHKRRAMRVDENQVSSDGFLMNVTVVLDGLCTPMMDATFSKISKIDIDYLRRNPRVNIKDETKLNADQNASDAFYETQLEGASNFNSEIFFLTLAAHHYGSEATNAKLKTLEKDIKHFQKTIAEMELERPKFAANPNQMFAFETSLKRYNDVLEKAMALSYSIEGVLFDDLMQAQSLQFMRYVIVFMLRIATGSEYMPGKPLTLPLQAEQSNAFRNLPEYILDDIVSNFKFIFTCIPHIIIPTQTDELIVLCITFLYNSEYIKNPHLKSGLVSLLYQGTWPAYHRSKGILGDALTGEKFANDNLLHTLMKFYIEAETLGGSNSFYNKFTIRSEIFHVIKCIWTNDIYKQRLTQESRINTDFFVRFVNLLLNDATYVLDEALTRFPKIHDLQSALKNPTGLTEEVRNAKAEELSKAEGEATAYMQLTNETVSMMKLFTNALGESFTMPEVVQRLADMMDYNLDTLVGEKSSNLKVENPEKYRFNPKTLLAELIDVYLNLGRSPRFVEAVAKDGRSYKPLNFAKAEAILRTKSLKSKEELAAWTRLTRRFEKAKEIDDQAEMDLGEIPEEFEDPIMATLMEDPVILPMSKQIVDRSTIRSHLLSDPTDPFNRQPMTIENVVPAVELAEKIRLWKEDRKAIARAAIEERMMDTSEG